MKNKLISALASIMDANVLGSSYSLVTIKVGPFWAECTRPQRVDGLMCRCDVAIGTQQNDLEQGFFFLRSGQTLE